MLLVLTLLVLLRIILFPPISVCFYSASTTFSSHASISDNWIFRLKASRSLVLMLEQITSLSFLKCVLINCISNCNRSDHDIFLFKSRIAFKEWDSKHCCISACRLVLLHFSKQWNFLAVGRTSPQRWEAQPKRQLNQKTYYIHKKF